MRRDPTQNCRLLLTQLGMTMCLPCSQHYVHHQWVLPIALWYGPHLCLLYRWLGYREVVFHVTLLWNMKRHSSPVSLHALSHSIHLQAPDQEFPFTIWGKPEMRETLRVYWDSWPTSFCKFQSYLLVPPNFEKQVTGPGIGSKCSPLCWMFQENFAGRGADVPPVIKFPPIMSWKVQVSMQVWASLQLFLGFLFGFLH